MRFSVTAANLGQTYGPVLTNSPSVLMSSWADGDFWWLGETCSGANCDEDLWFAAIFFFFFFPKGEIQNTTLTGKIFPF